MNDHRLLVHCVRTDYSQEEAQEASTLQNRHWGAREWAVLIVAVAAAALVLDIVIYRLCRKARLKKKARDQGPSDSDGPDILLSGQKKR